MTVVRLKSAPQTPTWVAPQLQQKNLCSADLCTRSLFRLREACGLSARTSRGHAVLLDARPFPPPAALGKSWSDCTSVSRWSSAPLRPDPRRPHCTQFTGLQGGCGGDSTAKCMATAQRESKEFRRSAPSILPLAGTLLSLVWGHSLH